MGILHDSADMVRDVVGVYMPKGFSVLEFGDQYLTYTAPHVLSKDFFERELGCGLYVSLDGNGRGTHTHDLNKQLAVEAIGGPFDLVTDFGTGEHIFDQVQLWRTIHSAMKPGGFFIFDRPSQGYPGHCYYRTDRCYFEDIAAANDYEIVRMSERVRNPASAGKYRGDLVRGVFRKRGSAPKYFQTPQQGRYRKILRPIIKGDQV